MTKVTPRKSPYIVSLDNVDTPHVRIEAYGAIQAVVIVQAAIAEHTHNTEDFQVIKVKNVETGYEYNVSPVMIESRKAAKMRGLVIR